MPVQPADANIVGNVSIGNHTEDLLAPNGVYVGEFEDVKNVAFMTITVASDVESAVAGLKFQWSMNGQDVDLEDGTKVGASIGLPGRAFAITPRAQFFRVRYINGLVQQGIFRLGVIYHSSGTGLISRPIGRVLTDENFAQVVRAVLSAQKTDGTYVNLRATDDGRLIVKIEGTPS